MRDDRQPNLETIRKIEDDDARKKALHNYLEFHSYACPTKHTRRAQRLLDAMLKGNPGKRKRRKERK